MLSLPVPLPHLLPYCPTALLPYSEGRMIRISGCASASTGGAGQQIAHLAQALIGEKGEHEELADEAPIDEDHCGHDGGRDKAHEPAGNIPAGNAEHRGDERPRECE